MKLVIPGGSGQVGTMLARSLCQEGHEVVVLSRAPSAAAWRMVEWDGRTVAAEWAREIDGCDAVINLAGRNVNCRYTPENRQEILRSRVDSVLAVGVAIARAARPPKVWLQASTATIYAHRFDAPNDETTGILGGAEESAPSSWNFSIEVARTWEQALEQAETPGTRKVATRSAMTMSPDSGGVFDTLLRLVRFGLGGRMGDGRQYVSWIHEADFIRAIMWLLERDDIEGAINLAAPNPLPNSDFMRVLRGAWGVSVGLPASRWMLEIGALLMRTESELILKSRRVTPGRLLASGFAFEFPDWHQAAAELSAGWRKAREERRGDRSIG